MGRAFLVALGCGELFCTDIWTTTKTHVPRGIPLVSLHRAGRESTRDGFLRNHVRLRTERTRELLLELEGVELCRAVLFVTPTVLHETSLRYTRPLCLPKHGWSPERWKQKHSAIRLPRLLAEDEGKPGQAAEDKREVSPGATPSSSDDTPGIALPAPPRAVVRLGAQGFEETVSSRLVAFRSLHTSSFPLPAN